LRLLNDTRRPCTKLLTEIRGIAYSILEVEDLDEMARQLADVFSHRDPLALAVGLPLSQIEALVRLIGAEALSSRLTIGARTSSGRLVGAMLTNDFAAPQPSGIDTVAPDFEPIGALLESLDDQYRRTHNVAPGSYLHLLMVGVLASFAGDGIAQTMIRLTLENGRNRGYGIALTEATGLISQAVFRKLGFSDVHMASYKQFLHDGRHVFASIEGNKGTILMEMDLSGSV
jgi:ribosomal protein S18 acetylase RimI-like enzyme